MMLTSSLVILAASVSAVSWDSRNSPNSFSNSFEYNLKKLPTSGSAARTAWSETYWPNYRSGIAIRWASSDPQDFKYHLYSLDELLHNMTAQSISQLSPAEKFDIFNGRYDYPMVKEEWSRTSPQDDSWEGICHGWTPAAIFFIQPNPITVKNSDGVEIRFASSDIKALLSYYEAQYDTAAKSRYVGARCNYDLVRNPELKDVPECKDADPAAVHILLTNQLGILKQGFVADIDRSIQVWNQPINSFSSSISENSVPRLNATAGTNYSVSVQTSIMYSQESTPQWNAHMAIQRELNFNYKLDIDSNGNIIGGEFARDDGYSRFDRFDFIWSKDTSPFFGYFTSLGTIYNLAINGTTINNFLNEFAVPEDHLHSDTHVSFSESLGDFSVNGYANNDHRSWSIGDAKSSTNGQIEITFSEFDTEKYRDHVYVYEGWNGQGALIAVLHGQFAEKTVTVQGTSALIVFKSDPQVTKTGFNAKYIVHPLAETN